MMENRKTRPKRRAWLWWSSGKDSAWALHMLRQRDDMEVTALVTTFNSTHRRVAMHGVRRRVASLQAEAVGLPLHEMEIPDQCSNEDYERGFLHVLQEARTAGVHVMAFGDLFLADVRRYRERLFGDSVIEPIFPLWDLPTTELAYRMVDSGLQAIVVCVDPGQLDPRFAGRRFDRRFLDELPDGVDPCGENGEFHTLACGGPMFRSPLAVRTGETVERSSFYFTDVLPEQTG